MASVPYEMTGSLRSRSNYYKPSTPSPAPPPVQSYETKFYMDEKTKYMTASLPNLPPRSFQDANMVSIPADMFDRMFLHAQNQEATAAKKSPQKFANPTPLSVVGFLLCLTPLSFDLIGLLGAGGNGAASVGAYFFIGGALMLLGGFLEWVAGNTFPFVVFASFGGFWLSFGATLVPFFNAFGAYSPDPTDITAGLETQGFNASFGFFMVSMAVLCLVYLICSLRTNLVFVIIFAGLFAGFILLTATFWQLAAGNSGASRTLRLAGASFLGSCMAGWYLLLALLLGAVDFPFALPLVDLSAWIPGASERENAGD